MITARNVTRRAVSRALIAAARALRFLAKAEAPHPGALNPNYLALAGDLEHLAGVLADG